MKRTDQQTVAKLRGDIMVLLISCLVAFSHYFQAYVIKIRLLLTVTLKNSEVFTLNLNTLASGVHKKVIHTYILKQTCSYKLQLYQSKHDHLMDIRS